MVPKRGSLGSFLWIGSANRRADRTIPIYSQLLELVLPTYVNGRSGAQPRLRPVEGAETVHNKDKGAYPADESGGGGG